MVETVLQLNKEKYIFWTLVVATILCVAFYIFCINSTVRNVVSHKNLEDEGGQLNLSIGNLEFQYITMRNGVTLPLAYSLGFKNAETKAFVTRDSYRVAYLDN